MDTVRRVLAEIQAKAKEFRGTRRYPRTYRPIHSGRFTAREPLVAYVENRMFSAEAGSEALIHEEPSEHALMVARLMGQLKADEEIVLHNAYLYLPARVQEAILRALRRGVRLLILTNSPGSSDLPYVARAGRRQYGQLLKMAPGQVKIYEYVTHESLHSKVWTRPMRQESSAAAGRCGISVLLAPTTSCRCAYRGFPRRDRARPWPEALRHTGPSDCARDTGTDTKRRTAPNDPGVSLTR